MDGEGDEIDAYSMFKFICFLMSVTLLDIWCVYLTRVRLAIHIVANKYIPIYTRSKNKRTFEFHRVPFIQTYKHEHIDPFYHLRIHLTMSCTYS